MENETWKYIQGWEGVYQISNKGLVKRVARFCDHPITGRFFLKEQLLKQTLSGWKYMYVVFNATFDGHKKCTKLIHRLVADAFIPIHLIRKR